MERGLVPDRLRLVESFLNSIDLASGQDDLDSVPRFRGWLAVHHREDIAATANAADLELARELRYALRAEAATHHGDRLGADVAWLDELTLTVPLRARASAAGIGLGPAEPGVRGVLGEILAAIVLAAHDGSWRRMKICRAGGCQIAYYDRSKNASRCWCSMQVCGNRNKTRAYRRRSASRRAVAAVRD
ncbi:MAG TPA: CGNR zinc finger domain-containing protein [Micromonosporaceae bacterium]|jgi:predicted RNA-binding Zn ribbon-like protein